MGGWSHWSRVQIFLAARLGDQTGVWDIQGTLESGQVPGLVLYTSPSTLPTDMLTESMGPQTSPPV